MADGADAEQTGSLLADEKLPMVSDVGADAHNEDIAHTSLVPLLEQHQSEVDALAVEDIRRKLRETVGDPRENRMREERDIVVRDPENVGMVIDHEFIVDPWRLDVHRRIELAKNIWGTTDEEIQERSRDPNVISYIETTQQAEKAKVEALRSYLQGFEGKLDHVRIHPPGSVSPLSLGAAVRYVDGERTISLPPEYVEQIRMIQEHAEDVTLVVQFFDHRNGAENASPIPAGQAQEDYIALCRHVLETFGDGVSLEFGVEPNISHDTDPAFERSLQYLPNAGEVDPRKYGDFYAEVAAALKEGSPDVRCIPAGTAFFDREFTEGMLQRIMHYEDIHDIPRGTLVNGLSFHPYRDGEPEEACVEVSDGKIVGQIHGSYEDQLRAFMNIRDTYDPATSIRLGEFNFKNDDTDWKRKLETSIDMTKKEGIITYIYPGFKSWE